MKTSWKLTMLILTTGIILSGCYTVLRHPRAGNDAGLTSDYYDPDACSQCHVDQSFFNYSSNDYYGHYQPLLDYYSRPWWWDAYWGDEWYYDADGGWRPEGIRDPGSDRGGYFGTGSSGASLAPSHTVTATKTTNETRQTAAPSDGRVRKEERSAKPKEETKPKADDDAQKTANPADNAQPKPEESAPVPR